MTTEPNIIAINIEDEIQHSYLDYAMSVIIGRALPDVRDGLKPVHRRILYAMHELGNRYNQPYKKSARVVGDVIGKYHPHGDSAVYDALVRMAQDFNMRVPLVDGQGNFGSVDGDPPAAMRYTEVRMSRAASLLLADIDKDTVDFVPNYDDSMSEPYPLPTRFPNLLVNGAEGIAVGMATKIPPHNLPEVIDAVIHVIENPEATAIELMQHMPGPDFPTGGYICGRSGILQAYKTGRGRVVIRARTEIEQRKNREAIIINELPFQVNKARLLEKIAELVRDKKIEDISDLRDESDRRGMRVVIELKMGAVADVVLNNLLTMTQMQRTFGVIMLAIVGGQPQVMSLPEVIGHFIDFRRDVVTRRSLYLLRQAEAREHILEGLRIALDHIDAVIDLIRASPDVPSAREGLQETFGLSQVQAQAILDMRLQKLTGLERDNVLSELDAVRAEIAELKTILGDDDALMAVIKEELLEVKNQFPSPRRTEILDEEVGDWNPLDLIADEDMVVTVSHAGYIKRNPLADYRTQRRGGKGLRGMTTRDEDFVTEIFVASTHTEILVFTTFGRVFRLMVYEVPLAGRTARGKAIVNLLRFEPDEKLAAVLPINEFTEDEFIITASRQGQVKRTVLSAYQNINVAGIIAVGLREDDDLVAVRLVRQEQHVMLATAHGKSICFEVEDVRAMGRPASGVRGIKLSDDDALIGMEVLDDPESDVLIVSENGYGKRTKPDEYPVQKRGGQGVITMKTSERNGDVVAIRIVKEGDGIILMSSSGQIIRTTLARVPILGRNTQGVKLISLAEEETLVGVARVVDEDDEEGDEELLEGQEDGADEAPVEDPESSAGPADAEPTEEEEV